MRSIVRQSLSIALLVPLLAAACRRSPELPAPVASPPIVVPENQSARDADAARERAARDAAEREARAREARAAEERSRIDAILAEPVYFEFDRSDLSSAARTVLDAKLSALRADQGVNLRVEGHADERGSSEYNLALAMRRAAAVRRYLLQREIVADRIEIVSFGEERPACAESGESCWRMNRRGEFVSMGR